MIFFCCCYFNRVSLLGYREWRNGNGGIKRGGCFFCHRKRKKEEKHGGGCIRETLWWHQQQKINQSIDRVLHIHNKSTDGLRLPVPPPTGPWCWIGEFVNFRSVVGGAVWSCWVELTYTLGDVIQGCIYFSIDRQCWSYFSFWPFFFSLASPHNLKGNRRGKKQKQTTIERSFLDSTIVWCLLFDGVINVTAQLNIEDQFPFVCPPPLAWSWRQKTWEFFILFLQTTDHWILFLISPRL